MNETYADGLEHACFAVERDAAEQLARDAFNGIDGDLQEIYRDHVKTNIAFWAVKLDVSVTDLQKRLGFTPETPPLRAV